MCVVSVNETLNSQPIQRKNFTKNSRSHCITAELYRYCRYLLNTLQCPTQYSYEQYVYITPTLMVQVQTTTVAISNSVIGSRKGVEARVSRFVELWRKLSDMSSGLMDTGRGRYEFNFAVQSVIVVQALYGIVALYIGRHHSSVHYNVYFPTTVWSILNLVVLCEAAYSVTNQVGTPTTDLPPIHDTIHIIIVFTFKI